ncbi:MAG TPA: hypothetical protein V6C72_04000, partial [Chroococcales cyanobacterium]
PTQDSACLPRNGFEDRTPHQRCSIPMPLEILKEIEEPDCYLAGNRVNRVPSAPGSFIVRCRPIENRPPAVNCY